jgi:hypothetical protein
MSPKLRNLLIALITAVAAAVVAYLQGCSPANLQQADRVFEAAQAQLLLDPESVTLASGKQLANDLRACLPSTANAADAGY